MNKTHELFTQTAAGVVAIARHGSFSRAGEAIGLTQSAVSHSVKELEAEVGVRLLDRTTREVVLTDAGLRLANRVERLLDELQTTLLDVRSFGVQRSGTVRVATSQTISAHLMPQCIAAGECEYPEIRIMLRESGAAAGAAQRAQRGGGFRHRGRSGAGGGSGVRSGAA
ncbi:LysR family transcriptional regulator [Serratia nematodiphila]